MDRLEYLLFGGLALFGIAVFTFACHDIRQTNYKKSQCVAAGGYPLTERGSYKVCLKNVTTLEITK